MPPTRRAQQTADAFRARFGTAHATYAEALDAGLTRQALRTAVKRGTLVQVGRGVLCVPGADTRPLDHAVAVQMLAPGAIATHHSAAAPHALPVPWGTPSSPLLARPGASGGARGGFRVRGSDVPPHRRTTIDGHVVTSLERTAIDLARGRLLPQALVPIDAALRKLVSAQQRVSGRELRYAVLDPAARERAWATLAECLEEQRGWPGIAAVRRALPLADPAAESPAESVSRGWLLEAGETGLRIGMPINLRDRRVWVDLADPGVRQVFEVDGWTKYAGTPEEVRRELEYERERQEALEAEGWRVRRWALSAGRRRVVALVRAARSGRL